jgi:hypothetical protein
MTVGTGDAIPEIPLKALPAVAIAALTQESHQGASAAASNAANLSEQAIRLQSLVNRFKVSA